MGSTRTGLVLRRRKILSSSRNEGSQGDYLNYDTDTETEPLLVHDASTSVDRAHGGFRAASVKVKNLSQGNLVSSDDPKPWSSSDLVEESRCQVSFCEMTAKEMNQIVEWWSTNPNLENSDTVVLQRNSLNLEEKADDAAGSDEGEPTNESSPEGFALRMPTREKKHGPATCSSDNCHLLVEPPLRRDVSFFSLVKQGRLDHLSLSLSKGSGKSISIAVGSFVEDDDIHATVQQQHEEINRLLYQTRDMADQMAFLTETSDTEDDEDSNVVPDRESYLQPNLTDQPTKSKDILRKRNRDRQTRSNIFTAFSNIHDDFATLSLQLQWKDRSQIWLQHGLSRLETTIVSVLLVPHVPLPMLLFLVQRPRLFRATLLAFFVAAFVVLPFVGWYWFHVHIKHSTSPASVEFFTTQPYYTSDLHYSLQFAQPVASIFGNTFEPSAMEDEQWRI